MALYPFTSPVAAYSAFASQTRAALIVSVIIVFLPVVALVFSLVFTFEREASPSKSDPEVRPESEFLDSSGERPCFQSVLHFTY